jgi:hypothetical protein
VVLIARHRQQTAVVSVVTHGMIHAIRSALRSGTSRYPMQKALFEYSNDETLLLALRLLSAPPLSWFLVSRYYQGNKSSLLHDQLRQLRPEPILGPHPADGPDKYLGSHLLLLQFFVSNSLYRSSRYTLPDIHFNNRTPICKLLLAKSSQIGSIVCHSSASSNRLNRQKGHPRSTKKNAITSTYMLVVANANAIFTIQSPNIPLSNSKRTKGDLRPASLCWIRLDRY